MRQIAQQVVAIDMHVHLRDAAALEARGQRAKDMARYFGRGGKVVPVDELADLYRSRNMMAVLMNSTDVTVTGQDPLPNDHIAEVAADHPDVFIGFGVVDPRQGAVAVRELRRCKEELDLTGIGELNPARQHFAPNDRDHYPLRAAAEEMQLPVLFHGGYPAAGSGTPGGSSVKLKYARPILLDDVAADFPALTVICAHPSWPWESEALAIALHKSNVYMDLSGWAPKYMSDEVRRYVNSRISDKASSAPTGQA